MLAHHDAEEASQPQFRAAMSANLQFVVDLLSLVGAFYCRSTFVDLFPLLTVTSDSRKQARIVLGIRIHASTIRRVRARCIAGTVSLFHQRTTVLAPPTTAVVAIVFHGQTLLANRYALCRYQDCVLVLLVSRLPFIEVDECIGALRFEVTVKGHGIVC